MKKTRLNMPILLIAMGILLFVCMSACGGNSELAAASGKYELFGHGLDGYVLQAEDMTSELTLKSNGTGKLSMNGESGSISSWSLEGDGIMLCSGGDTIEGTIQDGVLILEFEGGNTLYYAKEGTDVSSVPVMSTDEYYEALTRSMMGRDG